jgi:phosphohistidine phosphatase
MKAYFLRHGIARDQAEWDGADEERPLTNEGARLIACEAQTIAGLGFAIELVLTSPFARAVQTAEIVARALGIEGRLERDARLGPGFDAMRLTAIISECEAADAILLVGHEPGLSATIGAVTGGGRVVCKKGSLACVKFKAPPAPEGELICLLPPDFLVR